MICGQRERKRWKRSIAWDIGKTREDDEDDDKTGDEDVTRIE